MSKADSQEQSDARLGSSPYDLIHLISLTGLVASRGESLSLSTKVKETVKETPTCDQ